MPPAKLTLVNPKPARVGEDEKKFSSAGVGQRPEGCESCQFKWGGTGFCSDYVPKDPKLGLMLPYPTGDDLLEQRPWSGKAGYAWYKTFLEPFGLGRNDVLISHVLRCRPKGWPPKYPTGPTKRSAELNCRQYDNKRWGPGFVYNTGGLVDYDPNLFLITFEPADARIVPAYERLILSDLKRAMGKVEEGYRPLVLCGTEVMELVLPHLSGKGGAHAWRGHYQYGYWPWKEAPREEPPLIMFSEPRKRL